MQPLQRKRMRFLVIGDCTPLPTIENVGKSSLIIAMISQLPYKVEKTLRKVVLPPDMCRYSKEIFTQLVDTSVTDTDYEQELKSADLALLMYDVSSEESIERLSSYWLPRLQEQAPEVRSFQLKLPIILVGNKLDIVELAIQQEQTHTHVRDILKRMTSQFKQIQMGIECSAYYDRNVKNVLNCAQRAVLYPLAPLYSLKSKDLTPKFKRALIRIFRILDRDMDGKLSDHELASLQERVFKNELNADDIRVIKEMIHRELEEIHEEHITFDGFQTLHKKCIEMLKIQISWSILRYFRYTNDLRLIVPDERFFLEHGQNLQLSSATIDFLDSLFTKATRISEDPMEFIFRCSPELSRPLEQFHNVKISLEDFLLAWNYICFVDYTECYRQLAYIGYERELSETFKKTSPKLTFSDMGKIKNRKVISICLVESRSYARYLNDLFDDGREEPDLLCTRKWKLFSHENHAKIIILFKVSNNNLKKFLKSELGKKLDIVLYFQGRQEQPMSHININEIRQCIESETTMVRMISSKIAQQQLKVFNLSLDLQSVPVTYKKSSFDPFYKFVMEAISNVELGLRKQTTENLKAKQKNRMYLAIAGLGIAVSVGAVLFFRLKK